MILDAPFGNTQSHKLVSLKKRHLPQGGENAKTKYIKVLIPCEMQQNYVLVVSEIG